MPLTRGRRLSSDDEIVVVPTSSLATDDIDQDDLSDDPIVARGGRKRKRSSVSESSKSSPVAMAWTRQPPKPATKKKKKLIAGRELRERGKRKEYAEPSTSDEEFLEDDEEEEEEAVEDDEAEDGWPEPVNKSDDEEDAYEEQPKTRRIVLKIKPKMLEQIRQESEPAASNGTEHSGDNLDQDGAVDQDEVADLEAEIQDLQEDVKVIEDEEDDEGGPRRPTRRVTRQSSLSKPDNATSRSTHGRKGVARQDGTSSNRNGIHSKSPEEGRRSSMRSRLRHELRRPSRSEEKKKKKPQVSDSEFEDEGDDDPADDDLSAASENQGIVDDDDSEEEYSSAPRRKRSRNPPPSRGKSRRSRNVSDDDDVDSIGEEEDLIEELREIGAEIPQRQRQLRPTERMNYFIPPPPDKDDIFLPAPSSAKKRPGSARGFGGFGGFGGDFSNMGLGDRFRGITGLGTAGGADDSSDSDDEGKQRRPSAALGALMPSGGGVSGLSGTPANLGKYTPKSKLADADPLGVDQNIDFTAVGGLDDYINQLKEMVTLPLLYPEIFQRFNVTPPRGVLFHGPPGTGKTLMARALAASCSTEGRKISFFMRKGADCLSKWVGEAERQLRLLFEEAKNSQPSIIFFDEIDGLAPVRSSKQEQIHASIVSTLLALMDGMDGRGQVIVIGATNRPDSVDPALRRPGRFDREFYFPLPDIKARKSIIDIHTRKWDPPLDEEFKMQLALQTKGYGGADLRALCTEAALNAVQRRYPQIYSSTDKLLVDPKTINVVARDFMIATEKIVPSSERSSSSGAAPLPKPLQPLLEKKLEEIKTVLSALIPEKKKRNVLEEAMFEDDGMGGFESEVMMQAFESARTFRPRLLIYGEAGMGQQYLGSAILHHLEKTHVQSFDLATLMGDSARTPESALVQLFVEVKRHKPSVIYIPNMDLWFRTISDVARETFMTLIRGISPSDPILLLALVESPLSQLDPDIRAMFGYSLRNRVEVKTPSQESRYAYFSNALMNLDKAPSDFPNAVQKRKRILEVLEKAPPPPPKVWTKAELQEQAAKDKLSLNAVKVKLSGLMDLLKKRYQRFRKPIIDDKDIMLLIRGETEPECLAHTRFRRNEDGTIRDVTSNRKFFNMDLDQVNDRLWNGYYLTPAQFVFDIECMVKDSKAWPDRDRTNRAEEMLVNTQTYITEVFDETLVLECDRMAEREFERQKILRAEKEAKAKRKAEREAEKERLRLVALQQEQGNSPTKMIENGAATDVPMVDQQEDTNPGPGLLTNGADEGMAGAGNQSMLDKSPFGNQQVAFQNQSYPSTSVSPTRTQPYQPMPIQNGNALAPPANVGYETLSPRQLYPSSFPGMPPNQTQYHAYPGQYPPQPTPGMYPQPTYPNQSAPLSPSHIRTDTPHGMNNFGHHTSPPPLVASYQQMHLNPQTPGQYGAPQPTSTALTPHFTPATNHTSPTRQIILRPSPTPHPSLVRDPARIERLLQNVTQRTADFTLEQLEQVYAACMDIIWRLRHEWDRTVVISETESCIWRILGEIEMMQKERQQDEMNL